MTALAFLYRWQLPILFVLLALVILGPLLSPGYILTLDSTIAFNQDPFAHLFGLTSLPTSVFAATDNSAPLVLLMQLGGKIVPLWVVQKIVLFLILFLAGVGAARLPFLAGVGRYYAGVFYVLNPFAYVRLLSGQWGFLLGYALIPFAVKAFIEFLERPNARGGVRLALLITLVGLSQVHTLFLLALACLVFLVVWVVRHRASMEYQSLLRPLGVTLVVFLLINLYWLIPTIIDLSAKETVVQRLAEGDPTVYGSNAISSFGLYFDVASLHGFWRTGYLFTPDYLPVWWLPFVLIFFLSVYGFIAQLRSRTVGWLVLSLGALGILTFVLALGAAREVPGAEVFRDSHKFSALLALSYAYLGGLGLQGVARLSIWPPIAWKSRGWRMLVLAAPFLPLVYTFPMLGLAGQVRPVDFPSDWYQVRETLRADKDDYNILFLPWHMYMTYSWLPNREKTLANPARYFFGSNVIAGDNIEFDVPTQSVNPVSRYVELLLSNAEQVDNLGELLALLNVRYVILAHESDYETYVFLRDQRDLEALVEGKRITLYRNSYPISRGYSAKDEVIVESLEEILELSRSQNILEHVYVLPDELVSEVVPKALTSFV